MEKQIPEFFVLGGPIKFEDRPMATRAFITPQSSATTQPNIFMQHPANYPQAIDLGNYFQRAIYSLEKRVERMEHFFGVSSLTINTLGDNTWALKKPLNVAIEQRDVEEFVACLYDINLYGYGDTIPEALEDLKAAIINQFEYLIEQEDGIQLGGLLQRQLEFLKDSLAEKNA
jgi:hypothetical protein